MLIEGNVTVDFTKKKRASWVWFFQKAAHSLPSSVKYYSSCGGGGEGKFSGWMSPNFPTCIHNSIYAWLKARTNCLITKWTKLVLE